MAINALALNNTRIAHDQRTSFSLCLDPLAGLVVRQVNKPYIRRSYMDPEAYQQRKQWSDD